MSCPALSGPFSCGSLLPSCSLPWVLGWTKIHVKDRAWVFREKVIILELFNAGTEVKKNLDWVVSRPTFCSLGVPRPSLCPQ